MFFVSFNSTAWKVFEYGVFLGPCFSVFGLNTEKYGPDKPPYLDFFQEVFHFQFL